MASLLIGGTSHCGKSTLALRIGAELGWPVQSTDQLGRHPGRPWLGVPEPVAEFFEAMSPAAIYWFLRVHHDNMWPLLRRQIDDAAESGLNFVMEGSALRPERLEGRDMPQVVALCLHAEADFLVARMRSESGYDAQDARMRRLIDAFIDRSLRDNAEIVAAARQHDLWLVDVSQDGSLEQAAHTILRRFTQ